MKKLTDKERRIWLKGVRAGYDELRRDLWSKGITDGYPVPSRRTVICRAALRAEKAAKTRKPQAPKGGK